MKLRMLVATAALFGPGAVLADNTVPADVFSYSLLQVDRQREHSDFFDANSAGNGLKFSYDFSGDTYVFGQWNRLNFDKLPGSHTVQGLGVGAHQAYSSATSFYIDLAFMQDKLDANLGDRVDDYWRVSYGLRAHATGLLEIDAGIFTERNTTFGGRPFGERLGVGLDFTDFSLVASGEHTGDGSRVEVSLSWAYR